MKTDDRTADLDLVTDTRGVVQCYDSLALAESVGGISDFTEGMYGPADRDDWKGYLTAQARQANYLLDEVRCGRDSSILDIGCGYGRILKAAQAREARALGITLSKPQYDRCRENGLNVDLMNYRETPGSSLGLMSGIIANGSLEHFVQPNDAAFNHADDIYTEMFAICHRLLCKGGRLATTAIHFRKTEGYDPTHVMFGDHAYGSEEWQMQSLFSNLCGWYPVHGQLESCAAGYFRLVRESYGTEDYRRTSEFWLRQIKHKFLTDPKAWKILVKAYLSRDAVWRMIKCWALDQSWAWQFRPGPRGTPSPMVLYRQTWERVD